MLPKEIGKEYNEERRKQYLKDNCDDQEEVTYSRVLTPEELAEYREELTEASIALADIKHEKEVAMTGFKEKAKPFERQRDRAIGNLRSKSEVVTEDCYKIVDDESRMVGYYNEEGDLVSSRPAFANELQRTVFMEIRKEGTNN